MDNRMTDEEELALLIKQVERAKYVLGMLLREEELIRERMRHHSHGHPSVHGYSFCQD